MVKLSEVKAFNASLVSARPLVAVFVGGTRGIGEDGARGLARVHGRSGQGLRVYIVGRKKDVADKLIADCLQDCPDGEFVFVRAADLALLSDVDRVCEEITKLENERSASSPKTGPARVDLLVLTQAFVSFKFDKATEEGLYQMASLMYYSRMRCIYQLRHLLTSSSLPATVVSVFHPKADAKVFPDELSLRSPSHGALTRRSHVSQMTTFFMEHMARQYPGQLRLVHVFPGFVDTELFAVSDTPWYFRFVWGLVRPIFLLFAVSHEETGERLMYLLNPRYAARPEPAKETKGSPVPKTEDGLDVAVSSDGVNGGGAYKVEWNGEIVATTKAYDDAVDQDMYEKTWNHTMLAFDTIASGKKFVD